MVGTAGKAFEREGLMMQVRQDKMGSDRSDEREEEEEVQKEREWRVGRNELEEKKKKSGE